MNSSTDQHAGKTGSLLVMGLLVMLFQLYSRYLAAPVADFSSDAWFFLSLGLEQPDWAAVWRLCLHEPDRPIQAGILTATYRLFGDRPALYALLSMVMYSIHILLGMKLTWELSGNRVATILYGLIFSLWPNLFESFHWGAMIAVAYMQVAYVASALAWVLFVKRGGCGWLFLSVTMYGVGLASYEFGVALPFAFALLLFHAPRRRAWLSLSPFAVVLAAYLVWRFTKGFGMAQHGVLFPPREVEVSAGIIFWNLKEIVRWWAGGHMMDAVLSGLNGFAALNRWVQVSFFAGNIAVAAVIWRQLSKWLSSSSSGDTPPFSPWMVAVFGLVWAAGGLGISLLSWTAARLNFFPSVGITIFLAMSLALCRSGRWLPVFVFIGFISLLANQGTARQWQEAGRFQRNLFNYMQSTYDQWKDKDVLLIDSSALRNRQTRTLNQPADQQPYSWAYHGNASLLRGFVPIRMAHMILSGQSGPTVVLDVEYGARQEGDHLLWHERYNPAQPRETAMANVFVIDALNDPVKHAGLKETQP